MGWQDDSKLKITLFQLGFSSYINNIIWKMFLIFNTKKIWPWKNASMIKKKDNFSHFTSYFEEYGFTKWRNPIIQSST